MRDFLDSHSAFGIGMLVVYILGALFLISRCHSLYTPQEVEEIRAEYEQQIEFARDNGYAEGYHEAELEHEEDCSDGYLDGFDDGYWYGYDDGYDDGINNRDYEESYDPCP